MKTGAFAICLNYISTTYLKVRSRNPIGKSLLIAGFCLLSTARLHASGTAYDLPSLLSALTGGGNVGFVSNCTVVLNQTITISQNTVLDGNGYAVTISGSNAVRVFYVNAGRQFTLKNLAVVNGHVVGTSTSDPASGAGLYNDGGTVALVNCAFSGNSTVGYPNTSQSIGGPASGGAVLNLIGTLNVTNCIFSTNSAIGGNFTSGIGYGGDAYGGAIFDVSGTVNLINSSFLGNRSVGGLEALPASDGGSTHGGNAFGGAFTASGTVMVRNCIFSNNLALCPTTIKFESSVGGHAAGGAIYSIASLTMLESTVVSNTAIGGSLVWYNAFAGDAQGGGVFSQGTFNSTNCIFSGNSAIGGDAGNPAGNGMGGAIFNLGTAKIVNATISNNQVAGGHNTQNGFGAGTTTPGAGMGGGIFNTNTLTLLNSTLSGNSAQGGLGRSDVVSPGNGGDAFGGGIYNLGSFFATNDTLSGNSASGGATFKSMAGGSSPSGGNASGGAIFNLGGIATLAYQTISSNNAIGGLGNAIGVGSGGGISASNGSITLQNSIVANNSSGSNFFGAAGTIVDGGYNISSDISFNLTGAGSLNNTDPKLGALGFYGGPTMTVPLLTNSPAIDAAVGGAVCPATDQRGLPRPFGSACDIGAFEFAPAFSISGYVHNFSPGGNATLTAGIFSDQTGSNGNFSLNGVLAGSYQVTPSLPGFLFIPTNQNVSVGPDATNINFNAYRIDALNLEGYSNSSLCLAFAGTNGQTEVLESSSNLVTWLPVSTNVVNTNGIFEVCVTNNSAQPALFLRTHAP